MLSKYDFYTAVIVSELPGYLGRLPGQATRAAELLRISAQSNKHNSPEFYPGNAWACPGLEPPMLHRTVTYTAHFTFLIKILSADNTHQLACG